MTLTAHSPPRDPDTDGERSLVPEPLTEAQAGIWYAQRLDPDNPVFNTAQVLEINGPLDVNALADAIDVTMREADALAIRVVVDAGVARQVVDERFRARLRVMDLRGGRDPRAAAESRIRRDLQTPIDPTEQPLAAQILFRVGEDSFLWYQRIHHLAVDGFGTFMLTKRICDRYAATVEDREPDTAPFRSYRELLEADAAYLHSPKREADREFWLSRFADRPRVTPLKAGRAWSADHYIRETVTLPPSLLPSLQGLGEAAKVAWPDVVTGLVLAYLQRHTAASEVIAGVATMNRMGSVAARVPAMVMNVVPVRATIDEAQPLRDVVAAIGGTLRAARRHGTYRGEQIRRDLGLLSEGGRLYSALINVLPYEEPPRLPGLSTRLRTLATGPVDDLTIEVRGGGGAPGGASGAPVELRLEVQANPRLYGAAEVSAHARRLARFLDQAVAANWLAEVPTLTPDEHEQWINGVNATAHPVEDTTLTSLLERGMRAGGDRAALRFEGATLTYAELDRLSARWAETLAAEGVGQGDIVAVALPRSLNLLVAVIAILRAGAAYLPLDPNSPTARNARIIDSARPRMVLTDAAHRGSLPAAVPIQLIGNPPEMTAKGPAPAAPAPDDPAYVIYTSGSTGEPKGVVVEHRSIVNRLLWMREYYGIGRDDRILQKTPVTFDVSVWELFLSLISGGTLAIAPPESHRDPAWLATILREERITTAHFVPSMLAAFLDEPAAATTGLKRVFCSGEALPASLRDRFHAMIDAELHNLYGPTEAAVDVTYWDASAGDSSDPVPIGRPVWNTRMYVLDGRMRPVPPGVVGDLYIGGVQVARGYLGRPDLTAERFIPDPFLPAPARMYRTGDLAEWRPDGALLFHGRSDFQVKIRGFRIELGEIEAALLEVKGVSRAIAVAREFAGGDSRIVAYLVAGDDARSPTPDPAAIREALGERLPEYMVPAAFVFLDDLPLTTSGKVDRAALPEPLALSNAHGRRPESLAERRVADLFGETLGIEDVGVDDDFFLLGGHSLLAARLAARASDVWGRKVGMGAVFAHPTVARLAKHLDAEASSGAVGSLSAGTEADGLGPILRLRSSGTSRPALFCVHPAGGISWCYRALASALPGDRDVAGIQAVGLDPDVSLPETLEAMADDYVDRILRVQADGVIHLLGWSVGGIIAQAMAVQLRSIGREVGLLAMLDAYPADCWRNEPEPDEAAALQALLRIAGFDDPLADGEPLTRQSVTATLRAIGHPLGSLSDRSITGVVRVVERNARLVRQHHHRKYDGPVVHFRAALDHVDGDFHSALWAPYATTVEAVEIPALHHEMVREAAVAEVARVISSRWEALDGTHLGGG